MSAVNLRELDISLNGQFAFETNPMPENFGVMDFSGTVNDVIGNLEPAMLGGPLAESYWAAPRLMRAVLDNKRAFAEVDHIEVVNQTTALTVELFAGNPNLERLEIIKRQLGSAGLLETIVTQQQDGMTHHGTQYDLSYEAALATVVDNEGDDLLFMPLCHGGFAAGVQTALFAQRLNKESDVLVHPIRFSRAKLQDKMLHLTLPERQHLRTYGEGKRPVIFDEDAFTGTTISEAIHHLPQMGQKAPYGIATLDKRMPRCKARQGVHWENIVSASSSTPSAR
jgi:hypothetical protein